MKNYLKKVLMFLLAGVLILPASFANASSISTYVSKAGDTLSTIATVNGMTFTQVKVYNNTDTNSTVLGQRVTLVPNRNYTVKSGDTLWLLSSQNSTTIAEIKELNGLTSDTLLIGQKLILPLNTPTPVTYFPSIKYIVQAGDYVSVVAKKFGVPMSDIIKYNYMSPDQWLDAGETIAINGYAPRYYSSIVGESATPTKLGKLLDWVNDVRFVLKRGEIFKITDLTTGLIFNVKMLGGVNHSDVETLTQADTNVVKKLFPVYKWDPRPVVIFHDGMNIAASFSGMPHSFDTIADNGVSGHFDLYTYNSKSHSSTTSIVYINQHKANILIAAGLN